MLSDAELVARALAGSPNAPTAATVATVATVAEDAFRELVIRFERPVFALVARMVHDPATAEDLAQEVFVKAYRRLDTYDPARKFSSWLFKIAHNTTIDFLRRGDVETVPLEARKADDDRGALADVLADEGGEDPGAAAERRQMARSLEQAIARLRPEYRESVVLRYVEGLSYQEICEITGQPLGTVKTNLHRARKELAESMTAMGWAPAA